MTKKLSLQEAKRKIEQYCAYQDRCHKEVISKLQQYNLPQDEIDYLVAYLISEQYLNEERFAKSFARGKHRINHWGKFRIEVELKMRDISKRNISIALKEIEPEYLQNFLAYAERKWEYITEKNNLKKKKKFFDTLLRKGYEYHLIEDFLITKQKEDSETA